MDAVERGLAAVNEYVPGFMASHAGRLEIFTYGPAGDEPHVLSLDVGVTRSTAPTRRGGSRRGRWS